MTRFTDGRKSENVAARKSLKRRAAGVNSIGAAVRAAERGELVLDLIRMDGGTQSRQSLDGETINDYAEAMAGGARFPEVTVFYDGKAYWLADGFHRVNAAKQAGLISLPVSLHQGTQRDAILYSVGANASHGKRRTNADKRQAVERLLRDEEWSKWTNNRIAEQCAVDAKTVGTYRASMEIPEMGTRLTQRNGATYPMNTGNIGKRPPLQDPVSASAPPIIPALPKDIPVRLRDSVDDGTIGRTQALRMNNVLARLPEEVRTLALAVAGANEDKVSILRDLYDGRGKAGSNGTFDEIASTGGFYYGDDMNRWCDFAGSGALAIKEGLKSLSKHHAITAAQARDAARIAVPEKLSGASYRLLSGDFRSQARDIEDNSIDIILTDPPYPAEYLPLFSDLGALAARALKSGGSLLVMSGELYLPEVMRRLCDHLTYHWTLAYLTPGGQSPQIWNRNINTFWKPVLWLVKGEYVGDWQGDVIKSERNEKDAHYWQQSESGMLELVKRFSLPDQLILDPFCGSGTTGVAAVQLHRRFIGIDNDPAAIAAASERLSVCPTL